METKHSTPILDTVRRQHAADDMRQGVDPYNTGRHRVLRLQDKLTEAQRREAAAILACFDTELSL